MNSERPAVLDDRQLMRQVAEGDVRSFEAIYDRYSDQAFGLALRVTGRRRAAEEVTQDAFCSLWRAAGRYDAHRGALEWWFLSMVRNQSIDWLRREARHDRNCELDEVLAGRLEAEERTETEVVDREESRQARQLLVSLPREQRQVIELAYFKGLTHAEIAAKVDIPIGTVKGRLRLGLMKMHRKLVPPLEAAPTGRPARLFGEGRGAPVHG